MEREGIEGETVVDQLRRAGDTPLDGMTQARVLDRLGGRNMMHHHWAVRGKIGAAALAGFVLGGSGLASAGALPGPAQHAAHTVFRTVGVNVPPGHQRYNDPTACPGGPYANHGAYVRAHKGDPTAGASPCGKPVGANRTSTGSNGGAAQPGTEPDDQGDDTSGNGNGHGGPPPWAGQGKHGNAGKDGKEGKDKSGDDGSPNTATTTAPTVATPTTTTTATTTAVNPATAKQATTTLPPTTVGTTTTTAVPATTTTTAAPVTTTTTSASPSTTPTT